MQLADLYLYPMVKAGYDKNYRAYQELIKNGKIIDVVLKSEEIPTLGVKYSCFP